MNKTRCGINIFVVMAILLLCCNTVLADATGNVMLQEETPESYAARRGNVAGDFYYAQRLSESGEDEEMLGIASINDAPFHYSKNTELRDLKGKTTSMSYFKEGMSVRFAYKADDVNDVLTFMQHVPKLSEDGEDGEVSDTGTSPSPATKSEPIRHEGGVWKN